MITKILTVLFILFTFTNFVFSSNVTEKSGTTAFAFLKIGQGARATAMADCYVGLSDDINAIYWNPAGVSQLESRQILASHTIWFESINRSYLGYIHPPFKFGTLGGSINYLSVSGIEKRTGETDDTYDSISVYDMAISFVWGKKFSDKISLGAGLKIISENLYTKAINGFAIDLGGLYKINDTFLTGLSLQNIGSGSTDPLPMLLRAGISKKLLQERLILLSDIYLGIVDMTTSLSIGGEYKISNFLYPRIGYKYRMTNTNFDTLAELSAGFGLKYKKHQFDYAFSPYGDLGFTHRLDFLVKF